MYPGSSPKATLSDYEEGWTRTPRVTRLHTRAGAEYPDVYSLAFTLDSERIIATYRDCTVDMLDAETGRVLDSYVIVDLEPGQPAEIVDPNVVGFSLGPFGLRAMVSPNGAYMAVLRDHREVIVSEAYTRRVLFRIGGGRGIYNYAMAFSGDSSLLMTCTGPKLSDPGNSTVTVQLHTLLPHRIARTFQVRGYKPLCGALSHDGSVVALGCEGSIVLFLDSDTGAPISRFDPTQRGTNMRRWGSLGKVASVVMTEKPDHVICFFGSGYVCEISFRDNRVTKETGFPMILEGIPVVVPGETAVIVAGCPLYAPAGRSGAYGGAPSNPIPVGNSERALDYAVMELEFLERRNRINFIYTVRRQSLDGWADIPGQLAVSPCGSMVAVGFSGGDIEIIHRDCEYHSPLLCFPPLSRSRHAPSAPKTPSRTLCRSPWKQSWV